MSTTVALEQAADRPFAEPVGSVLGRLGSSLDGLSNEDAGRRLAKEGPNRLPSRRSRARCAGSSATSTTSSSTSCWPRRC